MARIYRLAPAFERLEEQLRTRLAEWIGERDPVALVHVAVTAIARIHITVVSDVLAADPEGEDNLWAELESRLPEETFDRITILLVLSVREALQRHGPADLEMLCREQDKLRAEWQAVRASDGNEVSDLVQRTRDWADTASLWRLSFNGSALNDVLDSSAGIANSPDPEAVIALLDRTSADLALEPGKSLAA